LKFSIGSKIRSYDFEPRPEIGDRFVEGTVISHLIDSTSGAVSALVIQVETDTLWPEMPREEVTTAVRLLLGEWDGRLTELG
jgi:hypothetical protein